jgi:hypothetical protein
MSIPTSEARRFAVGKYDIIATPIPHSAHMLRYTIFVAGRRIGAMASVPSESDCRFLENPPLVPPLVPWQSTYRPGRPKKDAPPRPALDVPSAPREEIPFGLALPQPNDER